MSIENETRSLLKQQQQQPQQSLEQQKRENTLNDTFYDDLYDFADMAFDENFEIKRPIPFTHTSSNDEDTDEDINLDYEYGYDYEKIIKDRLKAANEAFNNDSTPLVKARTRISFDNTVSAVVDEQKTSEQSKPQKKCLIMNIPPSKEVEEENDEDCQGINEPDDESELNKDEKKIDILKIPLNDTFLKTDPDKFNNKLKEINARYDEEHSVNVNTTATTTTTPMPTAEPTNSRNSPINDYNGEVYEDEEEGEEVIEDRFVEEEVAEHSQSPHNQTQMSVAQVTTATSNGNGNDHKVLIERDGQFLYVNSEEYLAKEQQRKLEAQQQLKILQKRPKSASNHHSSIGNIGGSNVYTININNKNNKISLNLNVNRDTKSANSSKRGRDLNKTRVEFNRTPEYGANYQSPYAVSPRRATSTANAKKPDEDKAVKEERKYMNESSFKAWLEKKEKQRVEDQARRDKEKSITNTTSSMEENIITFDQWLNKKRVQLAKEKEYQKQLKELILADEKPKPTLEEQKAAFKEWVKRKTYEKHDVKATEKTEKKKWAARYKRSRKYQRLTQAIELAQAYGYAGYYFSGFGL